MASMLMHPSMSSSSHSYSYAIDVSAPSLTQTSEFPSHPNAEVWTDIDLAESLLISSQFEEAVTLSSTILQTLRRLQDAGDDVTYKNELDDMMESSGMVLIQALSEGGRENIIFSHLETIFGHLSKVPPPLFFSGVCLQISAGLYLDAQASIECFLKDWSFTSIDESSCAYKPAGNIIRHNRFLFLKPEMYIDIVALYCIEVLTKGIGNINAALSWLQNVTIPADRKEDILRRLEKISFDNEKYDSSIKHHKMLSQSELDCDRLSVGPSESDKNTHRKHMIQKAPHLLSSKFSFFSVIKVVCRWFACGYSQYGSKWYQESLLEFTQIKTLFTGAAMMFIMIALYKHKHKISRILSSGNMGIRNLLHAAFVGLYDFWQLAFNVQLNPLAVATPQYGRR